MVRNPITAGQPVTQGSLVKPGDRGFLAAALGPGMRAITVPVSATSAVAGFVFPGDHVDLVLTQSVAGGGDGPPLKVSETIIRNLRVLATDQTTDNKVGDDGQPVIKPASSVTVEATPKIAEKIAVAQTVGDLSLSLRSLADDSTQLEQAIASGAVSVPANDPKAEQEMLARADTQPIAGSTTYATGADVSRFQRSTVPGKTDAAAPQTWRWLEHHRRLRRSRDPSCGSPGATPSQSFRLGESKMGMKMKPIGWPLAVALAAGSLGGASVPALAQHMSPQPTSTVQLNTGRGRLVTLSRPMSDVFVADDKVADVDVRSPTQLYVFAKAPGETTVYATSKSGAVVYSTTVQVGTNIGSVGDMLHLAMPDAQIVATPMNGIVLLTGTVAQPDDAAEAERLTQAFVGKDVQVLSRLRTATPLQVNLQVRVAEVTRSFIKNIGSNLITRDNTSGFRFGIGSGRSAGHDREHRYFAIPGCSRHAAGRRNDLASVRSGDRQVHQPWQSRHQLYVHPPARRPVPRSGSRAICSAWISSARSISGKPMGR